MKTRFSTVMVLLFPLTFSACVPTLTMAPVPAKNEKLVYNAGSPALEKFAPTCIVAVSTSPVPFQPKNGRASVYVYFKNLGKKEQNFSTGNIKVHTDKGDELKVYSYQALIEEGIPREKWAALAATVNGISRSMATAQAGDQYNNGTVSANGPEGFAADAPSGTMYNAAAAEEALLQADAVHQGNMANTQAKHIAELGMLAQSYLKAQTVKPGAISGGTVMFDVPRDPEGAFVDIDVTTADGTDSFKIELQKAK